MAANMRCPECKRPIYVRLDDDEDRCAGCVRHEERKASSSSAVPKGFWDRTKRDDDGSDSA